MTIFKVMKIVDEWADKLKESGHDVHYDRLKVKTLLEDLAQTKVNIKLTFHISEEGNIIPEITAKGENLIKLFNKD